MLSGLRPAVVSFIASAGLSILFLAFFGGTVLPAAIDSVNFVSIGIALVGIFVLRKFKPNPIWVILAAGLVGGVVYMLP